MYNMYSRERYFKDYEVQKTLGEGAFGVVKEVKHYVTGERFAVKEFKAQVIPDLRSAIEKEIAVLSNIGNHKNIVQLFGVLHDGGKTALLFEFCQLGDLDHYIREHDATSIQPLIGDMIEGLRFLHGKGIAHRDLKPVNILLVTTLTRTTPTCKIADFGLAKFVNGPFEESILYSNSQGSYLSTYCGTHFYMAPEVGMGGYRKVCDIFSLGAIFYVLYSKQTLVSGRKAYLAPSINSQPLKESTDNEIEAAVENLNVPSRKFCRMIKMMLKCDYKNRANIDEIYRVFKSSKRSCNIL